MNEKKISKMGSSWAIPLTGELKEVGFEQGDSVNVHVLKRHKSILIGKNDIDDISELIMDRDVFRRFKFELEEKGEFEYKKMKEIVSALVSQWIEYQQKDWYDKPLKEVIKESFFK